MTLRQAVKTIYPMVTVASITRWIRMGAFTPVHTGTTASGPGSGSELDLSDLVTIGILRSLFGFGLIFKNLDRLKFLEPEQDNTKTPGKIMFRSAKQIKRELAQAQKPGRRIQEFIEKHNYQVSVHVAPYVDVHRPFTITFYETEQVRLPRTFFDSYHEVTGHLFINVDVWFQYVMNRL